MYNTILRQAETGNNEYHNIIATLLLRCGIQDYLFVGLSLLYCSTRDCLILSGEKLRCAFSTRNICNMFLESDGAVLQSDRQSYFFNVC